MPAVLPGQIGTLAYSKIRIFLSPLALASAMKIYSSDLQWSSALKDSVPKSKPQCLPLPPAELNPQTGFLHILFLFAYDGRVWNLPESRLCDFAVKCKGCCENIPAPVLTMPDSWIVAECPLCGERRAYLPLDIFRGRLSYKLAHKPVGKKTRMR